MADYINLLAAFFGGIGVNFIALTELRTIPQQDRPNTFSDWIYCLWFFGTPILGVGIAYFYQNSGVNVNPLLSINIGASAPLILKTLAATLPSSGKQKIG